MPGAAVPRGASPGVNSQPDQPLAFGRMLGGRSTAVRLGQEMVALGFAVRRPDLRAPGRKDAG
jgi:hypothetical protein